MNWIAMHGDYAALANCRRSADLARSLTTLVVPALNAALPANGLQGFSYEPDLYHEPISTRRTLDEALILAIGLSFERDFRQWLSDVSYHAGHSGDKKARRSTWDDLKKFFKTVRSFDFSDMPANQTLDELMLLCNALRHGAGPSVASLYRKYPQLFADHDGSLRYFSDEDPELLDYHIVLNLSDFERFGAATIEFWMFIADQGEGIAWHRGEELLT